MDTCTASEHYRTRALLRTFPDEGTAVEAALSLCNSDSTVLPSSANWPSSRLSIAPMLEVTDRHFRYMMRLLSRRCKLYTEMLVDQTLMYNMKPYEAQEFFLGHSDIEHPLAVQLGGNDPETLGMAAKACEEWGGYDEINLNCGCPSPKVSERCFGARLMLDPQRVRRIVAEMGRQVCRTEVTVKCRLGADDRDTYPELCEFMEACKQGGVRHVVLHARKCLLNGLSAAQNRTVPPLQYEVVHQLCRDFPEMTFSLNGGVMSLSQCLSHIQPTFGVGESSDRGEYFCDGSASGLPHCHGVMLGRAAWHTPWSLRNVDSAVFGDKRGDPMAGKSRRDLCEEYLEYAEGIAAKYGDHKGGGNYGWAPSIMLRPLMGLFHGERGGKGFKTRLCGDLRDKSKSLAELLDDALTEVPLYVLDATA